MTTETLTQIRETRDAARRMEAAAYPGSPSSVYFGQCHRAITLLIAELDRFQDLDAIPFGSSGIHCEHGFPLCPRCHP